ncbi:MAG: hypothetical protein U0N40_06895, partial [Oscillospiraceae bacterium]
HFIEYVTQWGARRTQMFCTPKAFTSSKKKCLESLHFIEYVTQWKHGLKGIKSTAFNCFFGGMTHNFDC